MKYDLSQVPRPLHSRLLRAYTRPGSAFWEVIVGNDDFQVVVARVDGFQVDAAEVRDEVIKVLKAHRLLAGTATFLDLQADTHVR